MRADHPSNFTNLTNHLGNVLSTVSDRKRAVAGAGALIDYWRPEVLSCTDYYPFGMQMAGRSFASKEYRWGFQGQEEDRETGWVNYTYRMHDPRRGRFFAVDPLAGEYPYLSTYQFAGNKTIWSREIEGLESAVDLKMRINEASENAEKLDMSVLEYLDRNAPSFSYQGAYDPGLATKKWTKR